MDYSHCDLYNHLLTEKCTCGGEPEMLIDFVADFVVRCSKCRRSTHAYVKPEDAALHWNACDHITDTPLHIFRDDPKGDLQGEVVAIHISDDDFWRISNQSCDFCEVIFEYKDKMYAFAHRESGEDGAIDVDRIAAFNPEIYCHTVRPADGETIRFEKIIFSKNGDLRGIVFRWGDTWLFVFADAQNLILTRSSFDLSRDNAMQEASHEPALFS